MRLAIADPPYLGRAELWYGGKGRNKQGYAGRACGRGDLAAEYHPDAAALDNPDTHTQLTHRLERDFDGWAMAASAKTITHIQIPERARISIWEVTNAIPDGSRVRATWEAVIVRVPEGQRAYGTGHTDTGVILDAKLAALRQAEQDIRAHGVDEQMLARIEEVAHRGALAGAKAGTTQALENIEATVTIGSKGA